MKNLSPALFKAVAARAAVAAAAAVACSGAFAVDAFTFNPSSITGVSSPSFMADTITVNDFAKIVGGPAAFTEAGYLNVAGFNYLGASVFPTGFGSTYDLYVSFTASGASGVLTSLDYTVYGYTGAPATFMVSDAGATKSATTDTKLASGSLVVGPTNTFSGDVTGSDLKANTLTFSSVAGAFSGATGAVASFVNTSNQLAASTNGFLVKGGGGTINLVATPVPEPETYALMLGGLAAVGFVARRRSNG